MLINSNPKQEKESWNFIKKYKNPTIDFKLLQNLVFQKVKEYFNF